MQNNLIFKQDGAKVEVIYEGRTVAIVDIPEEWEVDQIDVLEDHLEVVTTSGERGIILPPLVGIRTFVVQVPI